MYYRKNTIIIRLTFVSNCDISCLSIAFNNAKSSSTSNSREKYYLTSKNVEVTRLYATQQQPADLAFFDTDLSQHITKPKKISWCHHFSSIALH